ncbi:MAG: hypothetical protein KC613_01925 [Myxococcales bacterium]|nr:hypothetical protein [Myxococcales bacterium]
MRAAGLVLILLSLGVAGLWYSHGAYLATQEKVPVEKKTVDDFGDEVVTIEWKKAEGYPLTGFHVGLDRAGPAAGGLTLLGGLLIFLGRRKAKKAAA